MPKQSIVVQCLHSLTKKDHFAAVPGTLYTGLKDPTQRANLNAHFGQSVSLLVAASERGATTSEFLEIIDRQINAVDRKSLDSEDAEQVASSFEHTLDCLGIESSGGILNRWMYGFDPKAN